jgi:hypothetical protein
VRFKGTTSFAVCQLILKTTGEILMQYSAMGISNACTVGIQNTTDDQGLTVAFNSNYLSGGLAVRLTPTPWLKFSSTGGYIPPGKSETVSVVLDPCGPAPGTYTATLLVNTTDPLLPVTVVPVSFTVLPILPDAPSNLVATAVSWSEVDLSWTDNATNESGFHIERKTDTNGTYNVVGAVGADVTSFADTAVNSRTTYYYRVLATNGFGASLDSNEAFATTPWSPLETWRQAHFGTPDNAGIAADTADPEGDGLINILEYAFNQDPNAFSASPISFALVGGHLTVTFTRTHPAPADINYIAEVCGDLAAGTWNSGPSYTSQMVTDNGDGTETVVVTDIAAVSSTAAHFLRIRLASVP